MMRFGPRLLWLGLLGAALAWVFLPRRQMLASGNTDERSPLEEPLPNRPDTPRGADAVMAVGVLSILALAAGLTWFAIDPGAPNSAVALALTHGEPHRAPVLLTRYGCAGCHAIPGAPGADGQVGPDLSGLKERVYIGGVLRNTPDKLIQWIVDPQRFSPHSAMPATGITAAEARDVAAYLYAH